MMGSSALALASRQASKTSQHAVSAWCRRVTVSQAPRCRSRLARPGGFRKQLAPCHATSSKDSSLKQQGGLESEACKQGGDGDVCSIEPGLREGERKGKGFGEGHSDGDEDEDEDGEGEGEGDWDGGEMPPWFSGPSAEYIQQVKADVATYVQQLQTDDSTQHIAAAKQLRGHVLAGLAWCDGPEPDIITEAGALPHLVCLMNGQNSAEVKRAVASLMKSLAAERQAAALATAGAVPALVQVISTGDANVAATAAGALANMAVNNAGGGMPCSSSAEVYSAFTPDVIKALKEAARTHPNLAFSVQLALRSMRTACAELSQQALAEKEYSVAEALIEWQVMTQGLIR